MNCFENRLKTGFLLCFVFFVSVFLKLYYSSQILHPYIYFDELIYSEMAKSFITSFQFIYDGFPTNMYPPLYPLLISPFFLLPNIELTYIGIKFCNAIISSLIIFPLWFLGTKFLENKYAFAVIILVAISPVMIFSNMIMSENLFCPLVVLTVLLIYESFIQKSFKIDILCGFCIGACYLTKTIGIVFLGSFFVVGLFYSYIYMRNLHNSEKRPLASIIKSHVSKDGYSFLLSIPIIERWKVILITIITLLPWIIRNGIAFGFSGKGILGYSGLITQYTTIPVSIESIIQICFYHISYLIIGSGFLLFILFLFVSFLLVKDFKKSIENIKLSSLILISWSSMVFLVIIASYHVANSLIAIEGYDRLQGRYILPVMPLIILLGVIGLVKAIEIHKTSKNRSNVLMIMSTVISTLILCFFYPITFLNYSAIVSGPHLFTLKIFSHISYLNQFGLVIILLIILIFLFTYVFNHLKMKYVITFVLLCNVITVPIAFNENVRGAHGNDLDNEIAMWFYNNDNQGQVLLDSPNITRSIVPITGAIKFWTDSIIIKNASNFDREKNYYVVSQKSLNFPIVYENKLWKLYSTE